MGFPEPSLIERVYGRMPGFCPNCFLSSSSRLTFQQNASWTSRKHTQMCFLYILFSIFGCIIQRRMASLISHVRPSMRKACGHRSRRVLLLLLTLCISSPANLGCPLLSSLQNSHGFYFI